MDDYDSGFAPAARADAKSVSHDARLLAQSELLHHVANAVPCILLILNQQRQIVFRNRRLLELLGVPTGIEVLGKRPGELFDCVHAGENPNGCGTTEFCRECGALNAIMGSQNQGVATVRECRITTNLSKSYDFKVWASPYTYADADFTIFSLADISDRKRRQVLEETFFHDVNNLLMVISSCSDMLDDPGLPESLAQDVASIQAAVNQLIEEVDSHRKILEAENGDLSVDVSRFNSVSLLNEVGQMFCQKASWQERLIVADGHCEDFAIETDRVLLRRVLGNMVKNGLEAISEGEDVRLTCAKSHSAGIFSVHNPNVMPRSVQRQVFQRSFSTKGKGRGTGTYSMKLFGEKYLNGKIWFSSTEEDGTTFSISVPLRRSKGKAPRVTKAP